MLVTIKVQCERHQSKTKIMNKSNSLDFIFLNLYWSMFAYFSFSLKSFRIPFKDCNNFQIDYESIQITLNVEWHPPGQSPNLIIHIANRSKTNDFELSSAILKNEKQTKKLFQEVRVNQQFCIVLRKTLKIMVFLPSIQINLQHQRRSVAMEFNLARLNSHL